MRVFLAGIPLTGIKVVVVGGGEAGLAKLRLFLNSPADLRWLTPDGAPETPRRPAGAPEPSGAALVAADFAGARLVFIALEDEALAITAATMARAEGAQVNVVDRPALSDFQTPALIDRDCVVVAIATGGAAPILARDVRSRIEAVLPSALGSLADLAGQLRDQVKTSVPDFLARRRFWERAFRGVPVDLAAAGRIEEARTEMLRLLDATEPETGVVHVVNGGPGDPELLTLKALSVLQDADLILHETDVSTGVLERARRDAHRQVLSANMAEEDRLAMLTSQVAEGLRVVWLRSGPVTTPDVTRVLDQLNGAGIVAVGVPGVVADPVR